MGDSLLKCRGGPSSSTAQSPLKLPSFIPCQGDRFATTPPLCSAAERNAACLLQTGKVRNDTDLAGETGWEEDIEDPLRDAAAAAATEGRFQQARQVDCSKFSSQLIYNLLNFIVIFSTIFIYLFREKPPIKV